jgi:CBS domain containing-hemolysin-like protein
MNIAIAFLLWCLVAVIATIRLDTKARFSATERSRLIKQGNKEAIAEEELVSIEPYYQSLQSIVRKITEAIFIIYSAHAFGLLNGIVLAVIGVLLVPLAFRVPFICRLADKLERVTLPSAKKIISTIKPVLRWLRDRDLATSDATLNSQDELLDLIKRSPGILSKEQQQRLSASLDFDDKKVMDVMTPRSMVKSVSSKETLGPLVLDELYKTGHSRFPVYDGDLDHVVGTLYLRSLVDMKKGSQLAEQAMQPKVFFIREDRNLSHALHGFLKSKHHLFIVVNEYRETVGVLSLEDVIENLLGATIVDEFDTFDDLRAVAEHNPNKNNSASQSSDI